MRECVVESDADAAAVRMFFRDSRECGLVSRIAAAEDDRLRAGAKDVCEDGEQKIDALLIDEARDHRDHRRPGDVFQLRFAQQRAFRQRFAG